MLLHDELGQSHLGLHLETVSLEKRALFFETLKKYGAKTLERQRALLQCVQKRDLSSYTPLKSIHSSGLKENSSFGEQYIREGRVGSLILAGGQATRFGCSGPKGALPITAITRKSLFQLFAESISDTGHRAGRELPVAVMTSSLNHEQTIAHFREHAFFGLHSEQLAFFSQSLLPFIDDGGNWLLKEPGLLAEGPDGNGNALRCFYEQGLWEEWRKQGVEYVNVLFVDNPLADPFDMEFIGFTARHQLDIGVKAIERLSLEEKMGLIVEDNGKIKVVEYSEFSPEASTAHRFASPGQFCFSMEFIRTLYQEKRVELPLHLARKNAHVIPARAESSSLCPVWKCETFQFDLLDFTDKSGVILYSRESCYAPLKNAEGEKSLRTVQDALISRDRKER